MELIVSRKRAENGANSIVVVAVVVVVVVVVGGGGEGRKKRRQTKSERKTNEKRDNKNTSTSAHASASTCVLLPLMKTQWNSVKSNRNLSTFTGDAGDAKHLRYERIPADVPLPPSSCGTNLMTGLTVMNEP